MTVTRRNTDAGLSHLTTLTDLGNQGTVRRGGQPDATTTGSTGADDVRNTSQSQSFITDAVGAGRRSSSVANVSELEQNAVLLEAMRQQSLEGSDEWSFLRDQVQFRIAVRRAIFQEQARAREALTRLMSLGEGAILNPPYIPRQIEVNAAGENVSREYTPPLPETLRLTIDGQTLDIPREIYTQVGFTEALAALGKVRSLDPTTGGAQGCGSGVRNELVSNAFQFLATNAALRTTENGSFDYGDQSNANLSYSGFVEALEQYGISATADQADGVGGGTVTLEGGRQVSDGVSDGNLDFKDLEWNQASQALADAIGIEVGDLFANTETFNQQYAEISSLLSDNDFNAADNDILVEVLLIASMIENAGSGSAIEQGGFYTRDQLEQYIANLDELATALGGALNDDQRDLLRQYLSESNQAIFANLEEQAAGSEEGGGGSTTGSGNRDRQVDASGTGLGRGGLRGAGTGLEVGAAGNTNTGRSFVSEAPDSGGNRGRRLDVGVTGLGRDLGGPGVEAGSNVVAAAGEAMVTGRSFVAEQANRLTSTLREEHRLKLRLLDVDLSPQTPDSLARNQGEAWNTLGQLRSINMDQKLPIMRELANYIVANRPVLNDIQTRMQEQRDVSRSTVLPGVGNS